MAHRHSSDRNQDVSVRLMFYYWSLLARLVHTFAGCICKGLQAGRIPMEKMIGWTADVAGMIFGGLKTIENLLSRSFRGSVLKTGILVKPANEKEFISHTPGSFA